MVLACLLEVLEFLDAAAGGSLDHVVSAGRVLEAGYSGEEARHAAAEFERQGYEAYMAYLDEQEALELHYEELRAAELGSEAAISPDTDDTESQPF